jgi:hypothetical protein
MMHRNFKHFIFEKVIPPVDQGKMMHSMRINAIEKIVHPSKKTY